MVFTWKDMAHEKKELYAIVHLKHLFVTGLFYRLPSIPGSSLLSKFHRTVDWDSQSMQIFRNRNYGFPLICNFPFCNFLWLLICIECDDIYMLCRSSSSCFSFVFVSSTIPFFLLLLLLLLFVFLEGRHVGSYDWGSNDTNPYRFI